MKALVVFGTRYGATAGTAEEIVKVLRAEGLDARLVNAREEKVNDISGYGLIIVGSGIKIDRWTREPEKFLAKFKEELTEKKVALFVSSGVQAIYDHDGDTEASERAWRKYLVEKAEKHSLDPISMAMFGGILDFNQMGWLTRKTVGQLWRKFEEAGYQKKDGIYDTRDWDAIRNWTVELAAMVGD